MEKRKYTNFEVKQYMDENKQHIFYRNKEDTRVIVPKYFGGGWTFNFARPISWVILAALIAVFVSIIVFAVLCEYY